MPIPPQQPDTQPEEWEDGEDAEGTQTGEFQLAPIQDENSGRRRLDAAERQEVIRRGDQILMPLRRTIETRAEIGHALRVEPLTREERIRRIRTVVEQLEHSSTKDFMDGLSAVIGAIFPEVGDVIGIIPNCYVLVKTVKAGADAKTIRKMILKILLDTSVGFVPIVGDVLAALLKSNKANLKILKTALEKMEQTYLGQVGLVNYENGELVLNTDFTEGGPHNVRITPQTKITANGFIHPGSKHAGAKDIWAGDWLRVVGKAGENGVIVADEVYIKPNHYRPRLKPKGYEPQPNPGRFKPKMRAVMMTREDLEQDMLRARQDAERIMGVDRSRLTAPQPATLEVMTAAEQSAEAARLWRESAGQNAPQSPRRAVDIQEPDLEEMCVTALKDGHFKSDDLIQFDIDTVRQLLHTLRSGSVIPLPGDRGTVASLTLELEVYIDYLEEENRSELLHEPTESQERVRYLTSLCMQGVVRGSFDEILNDELTDDDLDVMLNVLDGLGRSGDDRVDGELIGRLVGEIENLQILRARADEPPLELTDVVGDENVPAASRADQLVPTDMGRFAGVGQMFEGDGEGVDNDHENMQRVAETAEIVRAILARTFRQGMGADCLEEAQRAVREAFYDARVDFFGMSSQRNPLFVISHVPGAEGYDILVAAKKFYGDVRVGGLAEQVAQYFDSVRGPMLQTVDVEAVVRPCILVTGQRNAIVQRGVVRLYGE